MSNERWTPEQKQCIDDRGGTLLVSAAAGSGKTSVLVERIIRKITQGDPPSDIGRMLVVTFTNAAAAEMKQRIAKQLSACIAEDPRSVHLQQQQLALPRASISTIHSFCISLIRDHAYRLNLSPKFKIAEEQQLVLLRAEAMQEVLDECYREQQPDFLELAAMLSNGKSDLSLMKAVENIYTFIQSHPYPDRWLANMETVYDDTADIRNTVWGQRLLAELTDQLNTMHKQMQTAATLCIGDTALQDNYLPAVNADVAYLSSLIRDIEAGASWDDTFSRAAAFSLTDVARIRGCNDDRAKAQILALRKAVRERAKKLPALYIGTEQECRQDLANTRQIVCALYAVVRRFSVRFSEKKRQQQLLDFNDTEHFALQLLTEVDEAGVVHPTDLARELSEQYDEIMVDEYQDTNAAQDALFSVLSRDESNLFYVGDVKQSIYRFRQAMPELFIGRRLRYSRYDGHDYPATIALGKNFRSRREVTDTVNFVFRQLMSADTGGIDYDDREQLVCQASYEQTEGYETECLIVNSDTLKENDLRAETAEARVIAARIRHCLKTPCVSDKGGLRPAQYSDICILLRNKKDRALLYREELERLGIPVIHDSGGTFFQKAEIRLALSLLRCIDNPTLDVPLTAVMLSPLFGFTPDALAQLRLHRPHASCLYVAVTAARRNHPDPALREKCGQLLGVLERYRTLSASLTVDALLRRVYEDTQLLSLMSVRSGGSTRRKNLWLLHDLCSRFDNNGFRGLSAFIRHIDRLQEEKATVAGAVPNATGNAVRIMSIHGSKGLEFPIVFLANLSTEFSRQSLTADLLLHPTLGAGITYRDPVTFNRYETLPHRALALSIRNDSRAEELRVLYVAMTRAKEKLYLVMTPKKWEEKLETMATLLNGESLPPAVVYGAASMGDWLLYALLRHPSAADLRMRAGHDLDDTLSAETPIHFEFFCAPDPHKITVRSSEAAVADVQTVAETIERMDYTYPHEVLSKIPAKLAASAAAHADLAPQNTARSRPSFMSSGGLSPAERGTAMHTYMQFADHGAGDNTPDEAARLVQRGFLTQAQADCLDHKRLAAFYNSDLYRRMAASPRVLREYHFTCRLPACEFDSTLSAETEEFTVVQGIADCLFEENGKLVIVDYKTDHVKHPQELAERYRVQLSIYRKAIEEALNIPVAECVLYSFALGQTVTVEA